jgi:hypothetical protein
MTGLFPYYPVNVVRILVVFIIAQFILNVENYEDGASQGYRYAKHADNGLMSLADYAPDGEPDVTLNHCFFFTVKPFLKDCRAVKMLHKKPRGARPGAS